MTQLLHSAFEEAMKRPAGEQNTIASAIFAQINRLRKEKRPIGLADGQVDVPDSFFDPLPESELALWNGDGPDDLQ